jgi:hypothetical protein
VVHVTSTPGRVTARAIEDRDVRVTPIAAGQFRIRTHGGTGRIDGRTEGPIPFALAAERTLGGVAIVASGTRVDAVEPYRGMLRGNVAIDADATILRVSLTCPDLVASAPTDAALDTVPLVRGPTWHARVSRFRLRSAPNDDTTPVTIELGGDARHRIRWIERERREGWARIETVLAHARLSGWARDTDLTAL